MNVSFKLNASDLNQSIFDSIKTMYGDKDIEISIKDCNQSNQKVEQIDPSIKKVITNSVDIKYSSDTPYSQNKKLFALVDELRFPIIAGLVLSGYDLNKFIELKNLLKMHEGIFDEYSKAQEGINYLKEFFPVIYENMREELFKKIFVVYKEEGMNAFTTNASTSTVKAIGNVMTQCISYCLHLRNMKEWCKTREEFEGCLKGYINSYGTFE